MSVQSPLGNSAQQTNMMQMSAQSPLGNPGQQSSMMQMSVQSPMQAPSPLMAQSPIPSNAIMQSPGNPNMSPYNSQPSPRIGTPHSQPDEVKLIILTDKPFSAFIPHQIPYFKLKITLYVFLPSAIERATNEPVQSRWPNEVRLIFLQF